jgi:hypothetical protein
MLLTMRERMPGSSGRDERAETSIWQFSEMKTMLRDFRFWAVKRT